LQHTRAILQALDISNNRITDLSALGALSHLCTLDTSHNYLERLLDFTVRE
jgi:Leucine-rich repeat (LRR) protein